jgi:hypothetical protein
MHVWKGPAAEPSELCIPKAAVMLAKEPVANAVNVANRIANEKAIYAKYKDKEGRRVYMRDLMRKRRAKAA